MSTQQTPVAVIGLGAMGLALAHRLLKSGFTVKVWNRTQGRPAIKEVVDAGASLHVRTQGAIDGCKLIIVCVLDYKSVYDILSKVDSAVLKDKVIINLTNGTPKDAEQLHTHVNENFKPAAYFDGAIMTIPQLIGTEHSFLFLSGASEAIYDRNRGAEDETHSVKTVLESFGRVDYIGATPGTASLYDLALLAGMYGMFSGVMTAIGLLSRCDKKELPKPSPEYLNSGIAAVIGSKMTPMIKALLPTTAMIGASVENEDYGSHGHTNVMQLAGLRNIVQACDDERVDAGALKHLLKVFEETVVEGGGENGIGLVASKFLH